MSNLDSEGSDQNAHVGSLIKTFADSIIPKYCFHLFACLFLHAIYCIDFLYNIVKNCNQQ